MCVACLRCPVKAMRPCTSSGGTRSTLKVEFLIEPPCSEHLDPAEIIEIERLAEGGGQ